MENAFSCLHKCFVFMVIGFRTIMRNASRKTSFYLKYGTSTKNLTFCLLGSIIIKCLCGGIGIHGRLRACALIGVLVRVQSEASLDISLKCPCGGIGIHGRSRTCALIGVLVRVQSGASFPDLFIIRRPKGQMVPYPFGRG